MLKRGFFLFSGLALILFSYGFKTVDASDPDLIYIIIDQLTLKEVMKTDTPNLDKLQKTGAFSLMNDRTAGHLRPGSTYLSAGAGNRCQGSKIIEIKQAKHGGVFYPGIEQFKDINQLTDYQGIPGRLGQLCQDNNVKVGLLGNSDTIFGQDRTAVSMVMNQQGYIPVAEIGQNILQKTSQPWGLQTDWEKVKHKFLELKQFVDFLAIETGDISRIETYFTSFSKLTEHKSTEKINYTRAKLNELKQIDNFIGSLLNIIDLANTNLAIIIPTPSLQAQRRGEKLSWVLFAGRDFNQGWLSSPTTRRQGIITITDLLPITLDILGIKITKSAYKVIPQKTSWSDINRLNQNITLINNLRPIFVKGFILVQLFVLVITVIELFWKKLNNIIIISVYNEYLLLTLFLIPINYLLISNIYLDSINLIMISLIGLTFVQVFCLIKFIKKKILRIMVVTFSLIFMILIDLISGYNFMADSLLGYSSIIGARYYGLGNEYMGLLIGSSLIALAGLMELDRNKKTAWFVFSFYLLIIFFTGFTNLGANFGGMITAIFAGLISYLYLGKQKNLYKVILLASFIFIVIILLDVSAIFGPSSHIGQAVDKVIRGNWPEIYKIIYRKLSMNLKLLRWTIWTRVLLAFILCLIFLFKYPLKRLKTFFNQNKFFAAGFYGALLASLVTMVVNDSGVVAAATLLFYPILSLLYLLK